MLKSHVIEVDGVFVGAAIQQSSGYRFVAVAPQLTCLDGTVVPYLHEARRLAANALRAPVSVRLPLRPASGSAGKKD
ncbi:MAG: hypothetical protein JO096_08250 [Alphaproteobacteria bacterium]|nr:hypothetical protein [Alphaproteobacteria bacterium]